MLPQILVERLRAHRDRLRGLYEQDRVSKLAGVWMPEALERKYPGAGVSWEWYWFWPSRQVMLDPHAGVERRHHVLDATFQLAVRFLVGASYVRIGPNFSACAGPEPFGKVTSRLTRISCPGRCGGIGRRARLKIQTLAVFPP
jgi:hypothetical protein